MSNIATTTKGPSFTAAQIPELKSWLEQTDPLVCNPGTTLWRNNQASDSEDVVRAYLERPIEKEHAKDAYIPPETTRVCIQCGKELPIVFFYNSGKRKDGSRRVCCNFITAERAERKQKIIKKSMETTKKICSKCGRELPHESFSPNPRNADGRMATCKECMNAARNARRAKERVEKAVPPAVEERIEKAVAEPEVEALVKPAAEVEALVKPAAEVMDMPSVDTAPYNTIEIPVSGWLAYVPDDVLYGELINRGWRGRMSKTLASA